MRSTINMADASRTKHLLMGSVLHFAPVTINRIHQSMMQAHIATGWHPQQYPRSQSYWAGRKDGAREKPYREGVMDVTALPHHGH